MLMLTINLRSNGVTTILLVFLFSISILNGCKNARNSEFICENTFDFTNETNLTNWKILHIIVKPSEQNDQQQQLLKNDTFIKLTNLQKLIINKMVNELETNAFNGLNKLTTLILRYNQIEQFPKRIISHLFTLRTFHVIDCKLKHLTIGQFDWKPQLQNVQFIKNSIQKIPAGVFNHTDIRHLDLSQNQIEVIEAGAFFSMTNLQFLILNWNRLKTFEPIQLLGSNTTNTLHALHLNHNELLHVPHFNNNQLIELSLANNLIGNLTGKNFTELKHLQLLHLSNNRIGMISTEAFSAIPINNNNGRSLYLTLDSNNLTCLAVDLIKRVSINEISVGDNPWQCTCFNDFLHTAQRISNVTFSCELRLYNCTITCYDVEEDKPEEQEIKI